MLRLMIDMKKEGRASTAAYYKVWERAITYQDDAEDVYQDLEEILHGLSTEVEVVL
jgi:hypothetical protein